MSQCFNQSRMQGYQRKMVVSELQDSVMVSVRIFQTGESWHTMRLSTLGQKIRVYETLPMKTRPIAISRVLLANSDRRTDGPTDRQTDRRLI